MSNNEFLLGLAKCKEGNFEDAIPFFSRSLLLIPNHIPSLYNRAKALHKIGKFSNAIKDFNVLVQLEPNNADFYTDRGVALHMDDKSEQALTDFNKAVALDPSNPYRYSSRAFVKAKMGNVFSAIDDYNQCIKLDPEDAVAYNNLGLLEQQLGYKQGAKESFLKADKLTAGEKNQFKKSAMYESMPIETKHTKKDISNSSKQGIKSAEADNPSRKVSTADYLKIIKEIFTNKNTQKEFMRFTKDLFKRKS